jgi:SAM-dependent methyltransferase
MGLSPRGLDVEATMDYQSITTRQQATWATGDFHELARQLTFVSETLCRAVDPHAGQRVLDVACGSGNVALAAARRYCDVAGIDYVPALVERAKARAAAEAVQVDFRVADAQALPFPDASFDAVLSQFGVMFAPDQEKAAGELLRVCRKGGRIGLVSWMPEGFGGDFFATVARHVPPPPGVTPPVRWGTDSGLAELLGPGITSITSDRRSVFQYYRSVEHAIDVFRTYFGPTARAFAMLAPDGQKALRTDIEALFRRYNRATDGTAVLEGQYLQTVAIRA